jgi:probable H4MPT-linked C1 transfer pathway protein
MSRAVIGLDVGGANLKAAHLDGGVRNRAFALWRNPAGLAAALRDLFAELPAAGRVALTMTGELCDCFATRRDGVRHILSAVESVVGRVPLQVWRTDGRFCDADAARADPLQVAAGNWLALATYAGRFVPRGAALLLDVGSTTTDIVPLWNGQPTPHDRDDPGRLRSGELVYTGVRRTPLCALLAGEGAAEVFATTLDAYLLQGELAGIPRTRTRPMAGPRRAPPPRPASRGCSAPTSRRRARRIAEPWPSRQRCARR